MFIFKSRFVHFPPFSPLRSIFPRPKSPFAQICIFIRIYAHIIHRQSKVFFAYLSCMSEYFSKIPGCLCYFYYETAIFSVIVVYLTN